MEMQPETTLEQKKLELAIKKKSKKNAYVFILIVSVLISSFFGAVFGFMGGSLVNSKIFGNFPFLKNQSASKSTNIIKQQVVEEDSAVVDVVEKTSPAVVSIVITKDVPKIRNFFENPFGFPDIFGFPNQDNEQNGETQKETIGGGTGFFITSDGMIVTNKHVVSDTDADYTVITNDEKEHSAKVLARDPINDIAIIKIDDADNYSILNLGNSDTLKIGQTVIAIGNSLGEFSNTVSRGIISGLKRTVTAGGSFIKSETLTNIIQTDAAINPGNSGGPLLNIGGEVVGVNVAMAQGAQSIGFAIPSNQIKKIIEQVKTTGKITTPYIGVRYIPLDEDIQKENNLPYNYGVLVARGQKVTDFAVIPGSPADKAGIMENDILLEVNSKKIDDKNTLTNLIAEHSVGDNIMIKLWHKGEIKNVSVKLEERK